MRHAVVLLVLALLGSPALARNSMRLFQASLQFEAMNQPDADVRARIASWLADPTRTATDVNGRGGWIATDGEIVLVNGRLYRQSLGRRPWAIITPDGNWAAGGSAGALANGSFHAGATLAQALQAQLQRTSAPSATDPAPVAARAPSNASDPVRLEVIRDTVPPTVAKIELILHPGEPDRRVVVPAGGAVFVGQEAVGIRVTMSEHMGAAPRVQITQPNFQAIQAALTDESRNPVFEYQVFPFGAPANNGPVKIQVLGKNDGQQPGYGYDDAGNPIAANDPTATVDKAFSVDTVAPDVRRVDISQPGNYRMVPPENKVLPKNGFPKEILVLVADYNQPDDGTFSGPNVATDKASGVDFDKIDATGNPLNVRLFDPKGKEIKGIVVSAAPSALRLLLPDVYDPASGVFPDTDQDGVADPIEGTYRVQVDLIDKAGNVTTKTLPFGEDTTPIGSTSVSVSIRPVFTTPFVNPKNPIGDTGTCVKKLERVEITSDDPQFDAARSTAKVLSQVLGPGTVPKPMKTTVTHDGKTIVVAIDRDQNGDGQDDFENPTPGPYVPPGEVDPRLGKNDGNYVVEVTVYDKAGNVSTVTKEILLDTTAPKVQGTFPDQGVKLGPEVRIVDAILTDPKATSGQAGAGVKVEVCSIKLKFLGNAATPGQFIRGITFFHTPNDSDPTHSDYNPNDHYPKILFEITDAHGDSTPLPKDGSFDGGYHLEIVVRDQAGNESSGITSFSYDHATTSTTSTTSVLAITRLVPVRAFPREPGR